MEFVDSCVYVNTWTAFGMIFLTLLLKLTIQGAREARVRIDPAHNRAGNNGSQQALSTRLFLCFSLCSAGFLVEVTSKVSKISRAGTRRSRGARNFARTP